MSRNRSTISFLRIGPSLLAWACAAMSLSHCASPRPVRIDNCVPDYSDRMMHFECTSKSGESYQRKADQIRGYVCVRIQDLPELTNLSVESWP